MKTFHAIEDGFGRQFPYLRLSITDVCNFRCTYCLPTGYKKTRADGFLSRDEIRRLVTAFAGMGTTKIRLTGGEPTVRDDFCSIVETVAAVPGVQKVAVTTNGYKLPQRIADYYRAGLRAINVSIDSLDPRRFQDITGHDRLQEAVEGVEKAVALGFESVKVNAVLLKGLNDDEIDGFLSFIKERPVSLRFIELMQTGDNLVYFRQHHVPATVVREKLAARGWQILPRAFDAGPAVEYAHADYQGRVGIIAPYAKNFCATCNRLRVSAFGDLQLCLFGEQGYPLRDLLQGDDQEHELQQTVRRLMQHKKATHFLHDGQTGIRQNLSSSGG